MNPPPTLPSQNTHRYLLLPPPNSNPPTPPPLQQQQCQQDQEQPPKPPRLCQRRKPDPAAPSKTPPPCSECGKRFLSWKALFGHMRCHPDREWRGINPPPHCRRRPVISSNRSESCYEFTDEERQVASSLIMLANCPPKATTSTTNLKVWSRGEQCGHHKCDVCCKGFSSRQALGGHKRCHWEKGEENALDLNLPPPVERNEKSSGTLLDLRLGI